MGEEVYPFVRSFCEEHFRELSGNILIGGQTERSIHTRNKGRTKPWV